MGARAVALVGDIGGTNARFALADERGEPRRIRSLAVADHASLGAAIARYLADLGEAMPTICALAVAGPVTGDIVALTNAPWRFSRQALAAELGTARLEVLNDFEANALSLPHLPADALIPIGNGTAIGEAARLVLGPGTGLGVAALVPDRCGGWLPVAGEGGHATLPAADDGEAALIARARAELGHVAAEDFICGPGLERLHKMMCGAKLSAAEIVGRALDGEAEAAATVTAFCRLLATVAGDLALAFGARGGVYLAGGVVQHMAPLVTAAGFRERFVDKGRFRGYLEAIPTWIVDHPAPALLGLARHAAVGAR